jgi:site-specific recombinase XerD
MQKTLRTESFPALLDFLTHHETIKNHSKRTIQEYFLDLRLFFRFLKIHKGLADESELDVLPINDVDEAFIRRVTLSDAYAFLSYLSDERKNPTGKQPGDVGLGASARARKVVSIRTFFKFCAQKAHILDKNPMLELDMPRLRKTLPRYLTEDECLTLLRSIGGAHRQRDYAMITLFLNCGLRISELAGINLSDVQGEALRVLGKGNKERVLYMNQACADALAEYLKVRPEVDPKAVPALFLSSRYQRIHVQTIHVAVKKHLAAAGLDASLYSSHKLRHTAATLMLGHGVDVRTLQELLGHENLNTTQIYTHIDNSQLRDAARANPLGKVKPPSEE